MSDLTHVNADGEVHMVDIANKAETHRVAIASGIIHMQSGTLKQIKSNSMKKGDVLSTARIAGIMAAKRTADLIPLCHPLSLSHIEVALLLDEEKNLITCEVKAKSHGRTGVEMEALTAVQIALLTIYDMCKAVDKGMTITEISLQRKSGGKSGDWIRE